MGDGFKVTLPSLRSIHVKADGKGRYEHESEFLNLKLLFEVPDMLGSLGELKADVVSNDEGTQGHFFATKNGMLRVVVNEVDITFEVAVRQEDSTQDKTKAPQAPPPNTTHPHEESGNFDETKAQFVASGPGTSVH